MMVREWNHPPILARIADGVVKGGLSAESEMKKAPEAFVIRQGDGNCVSDR